MENRENKRKTQANILKNLTKYFQIGDIVCYRNREPRLQKMMSIYLKGPCETTYISHRNDNGKQVKRNLKEIIYHNQNFILEYFRTQKDTLNEKLTSPVTLTDLETPVIFDNDLKENDEIEDFTEDKSPLQINVEMEMENQNRL